MKLTLTEGLVLNNVILLVPALGDEVAPLINYFPTVAPLWSAEATAAARPQGFSLGMLAV
jgi:hypothetical protein